MPPKIKQKIVHRLSMILCGDSNLNLRKSIPQRRVVGIGGLGVLMLLTMMTFQNCTNGYHSFSSTLANSVADSGTPAAGATAGGSNTTSTNGGSSPTTLVLGTFSLTGVSASNGVVGATVIGDRNPTLYWTAANNASQYVVGITDTSGTVACAPQTITGLSYTFSACGLPDGHYLAQASAVGLGTTIKAPEFAFVVEANGPSVVIQPALVTGQNASMSFAITPSLGALSSAVCTLSGPTGFTSQSDQGCLKVSSEGYSSLPYGDYTFAITAVDQYLLKGSAQIVFSITAPPCTPLVNYNPDCDQRLKATLYFHTSLTGQPVWNSVNTYINQGIKTGTLYFTDLWIPTRSFTTGFPEVSSRTEYFALDIRTKLQPSASMPAGLYQIGIISDDGAIVSQIDSSGKETEILNQDGYTATRVGCGGNVTLTAGQKINLRVRYFQGPRDAIALVLMYRPATMVGANSPIACGTVDQDLFGKFPVPVLDPSERSYPGTSYAELLTQGWLPIPATSYYNPDL